MYFPYFITYIVVGFALSLIVFIWALKNGQFQDQQRARFLPLEEGMPSAPARASRWKRLEIYALFFLAGAGLLSSGAVLIFALMSAT
ncbi:MAG: cbb3-type cytochrome oxidase assembly protein CcoS [Desulfobacterales bacterium]|jgi:cbb3-type cytochrome oxidase maturation protein|nr:cbb3-type cytochrome oxidase assembly protein CcoS [Desulfobacterales bacterium]